MILQYKKLNSQKINKFIMAFLDDKSKNYQNETHRISRLGMKGNKIRLREHLRNQLLKTKYTYNISTFSTKQTSNIPQIYYQDPLLETDSQEMSKTLQFAKPIMSQSASNSKTRKIKTSSQTRKGKNSYEEIQNKLLMITSSSMNGRSKEKSKSMNKFVSENLQPKMNQYLNLLINESVQNDSEYDNKKNLFKQYHTQNISHGRTFYRKMKLSLKRKTQQHSHNNISIANHESIKKRLHSQRSNRIQLNHSMLSSKTKSKINNYQI